MNIEAFFQIFPSYINFTRWSDGQKRWANCFWYWQCSHYILQIFKTCQEFIPSYSWHTRPPCTGLLGAVEGALPPGLRDSLPHWKCGCAMSSHRRSISIWARGGSQLVNNESFVVNGIAWHMVNKVIYCHIPLCILNLACAFFFLSVC